MNDQAHATTWIAVAAGGLAIFFTLLFLVILTGSEIMVRTAENGKERARSKAEEGLYWNCQQRFRSGVHDQTCITFVREP